MGCATSKQPVCRNCKQPPPCSPMPRSYSVHVHHPPQREGDSYHLVALTSTTLGSLKLNHSHRNSEEKDIAPLKNDQEDDKRIGGDDRVHDKRSKEVSMGVIEAKTWSQMINEKIPRIAPKTPITTPPGEPETINTWELMAGLEDTSPLRPVHHLRSFSFPFAPTSIPESKKQEIGESSPKPTWLEIHNESNSNSNLNSNSNATSIISEFDPDVISAFREALEEIPPAKPFHLEPLLDSEKQQAMAGNIRPLELTDLKKIDGDFTDCTFTPRGKDRVVLYFTSLRGVRKTYEDCCHVRVILKGIGVRVDERDVWMHSGFREELKELMGDGFNGSGLPRVFVGKKYIGGAEEIRRLNEEGKLEKLLQCCEMVEDGGAGVAGGGGVCEACGDIRFVLCETCSGSCKIYYEVDYDEECDESDYGFQRCPDCNENGITRCPICCDLVSS